MSKVGAKIITNIGQHNRNLDATDDYKVVGNRGGVTPPASQKWVITLVPDRDLDPYERFTIYNDYYKKYLDYDGVEVVLTDARQYWEIQSVDDGYKIVVDNAGRACSLNSDADGAPVTVQTFLGPNEEWKLGPYVDPTPVPPPTGIRGIVSVAYKDRAIESGSIGSPLHGHSADDCTQAWAISAEGDGYALTAHWADNLYLGAEDNAFTLSTSKFIWTITEVNGNYKIGYSNQKELCISIPEPPISGPGFTFLNLSPYVDSHQEWFFKEFPLGERSKTRALALLD